MALVDSERPHGLIGSRAEELERRFDPSVRGGASFLQDEAVKT